MNTGERVTLGVQAGDPEADAAVKPYYMELRSKFSSHCRREYGRGFKELGIVLRIDGRLWHWKKSGCANLRVTKDGDISIDVFMPKGTWQESDGRSIRAFLATETSNAARMAIERLKEKRVDFRASEFESDVMSAIAEFRSSKS